METLSSQAFGAQKYRKLGLQTQTAIVSLILVCLPVSLSWVNMRRLFILTGQDLLISSEASKFAVWLLSCTVCLCSSSATRLIFQVQSLITPMLISSCATIFFHTFVCWVLVLKLELNNIGAALAIGVSYWLNVLLLGLYIKFSSTCVNTRVPVTVELFHGIREFFCLAIPIALMACLEWWSFEILAILSRFLPNPKLETSVLLVCLSTVNALFTIPDGLSASASTSVSNALGAGNSQATKLAIRAVMLLTIFETTTVSSILYASRNCFGYLFSNEKEVVDYVTKMSPLVCLCVMLNGLQSVLSGIARGCDWQDLGTYVNLAAYYLCGIPIAAILGFWLKQKGKDFGLAHKLVLLCKSFYFMS